MQKKSCVNPPICYTTTMKKETKAHYFGRLDDIRYVTNRIAHLREEIEELKRQQQELIMGPDAEEMKLVSSKTLIKWGEEWLEKNPINP